MVLALGLAAGACGGSSSGDTDGGGSGSGSGSADGGSTIDADISTLPKFSFFVTSIVALQDLSGSQDGFGGDLRYGETGDNAGLRGADKLCGAIADRSMPGASAKEWHAFLSAKNDGAGNVVKAIDRIGSGPWYDRTGRVLAPSLADLMGTRPANGDATIMNDFPNEDGVPNHRPDTTQPAVDNHDMLTGTNTAGGLYSQTATCNDWTSSAGNIGKPRVGHSWPRQGGGGGGGGGGSMNSWMSSLDESGCAPGVNLVETGGPNPNEDTVGSGGGYGGFYCFAMNP